MFVYVLLDLTIVHANLPCLLSSGIYSGPPLKGYPSRKDTFLAASTTCSNVYNAPSHQRTPL